MMNYTAIIDKGMQCLTEELGILEAEQFVYLLLSQPFDYTKWREKNLCPNMSIDEISEAADRYCNENSEIPT